MAKGEFPPLKPMFIETFTPYTPPPPLSPHITPIRIHNLDTSPQRLLISQSLQPLREAWSAAIHAHTTSKNASTNIPEIFRGSRAVFYKYGEMTQREIPGKFNRFVFERCIPQLGIKDKAEFKEFEIRVKGEMVSEEEIRRWVGERRKMMERIAKVEAWKRGVMREEEDEVCKKVSDEGKVMRVEKHSEWHAPTGPALITDRRDLDGDGACVYSPSRTRRPSWGRMLHRKTHRRVREAADTMDRAAETSRHLQEMPFPVGTTGPQMLSAKCQTRGFNPQFSFVRDGRGGWIGIVYLCKVRIVTYISYATEKEAKQAVAFKALRWLEECPKFSSGSVMWGDKRDVEVEEKSLFIPSPRRDEREEMIDRRPGVCNETFELNGMISGKRTLATKQPNPAPSQSQPLQIPYHHTPTKPQTNPLATSRTNSTDSPTNSATMSLSPKSLPDVFYDDSPPTSRTQSRTKALTNTTLSNTSTPSQDPSHQKETPCPVSVPLKKLINRFSTLHTFPKTSYKPILRKKSLEQSTMTNTTKHLATRYISTDRGEEDTPTPQSPAQTRQLLFSNPLSSSGRGRLPIPSRSTLLPKSILKRSGAVFGIKDEGVKGDKRKRSLLEGYEEGGNDDSLHLDTMSRKRICIQTLRETDDEVRDTTANVNQAHKGT